MKRILVTGGCGFIGREVVCQLMEKDYQVIVADNLSNPQSKKLEYDCVFHEIDVGEYDKTHHAMHGIDACIHLAAWHGAVGYVDRHRAHILSGNNRIYEGIFPAAAWADAAIQRLVFVSSSTVYGATEDFPAKETDLMASPIPDTTYGRSKLIGEWYCRAYQQQYGLPYTIIRPSNVYGIEERPGGQVGDSHVIPDLFRKIASGQYPVELLGDGRQTRCWIHVKDLVRGIIMAMESKEAENEDFNMGGAEEVSIIDLARMIWEFCDVGKELRVSYVRGFAGDIKRQFMSIDKARRMLGWEPGVDFRDSLRQMVGWLKNG